MMSSLPPLNQAFDITFIRGYVAHAVRVEPDSPPREALQALGLDQFRPAIFVIGGASRMSEANRARTVEIIRAVAAFAQERGAVIIDGGTEAGIMQILGDARLHGNHTFPLIGVAPVGKISYPGYQNPDEEAYLEDTHTHFVLVNGPGWGDESEMLLNLAQDFGDDGRLPVVGVLINGGRVAMHEVYLASTRAQKLPVIVTEGSGRTADEIVGAVRSGSADQHILQVILAEGDLQLVTLNDGASAITEALAARFTLMS